MTTSIALYAPYIMTGKQVRLRTVRADGTNIGSDQCLTEANVVKQFTIYDEGDLQIAEIDALPDEVEALPDIIEALPKENSVITPTIGRKVWYWPYKTDTMECIDPGQPFDATVIYVWSERMVNLLVVDHQGGVHIRTSTVLMQPEDPQPIHGEQAFAEWMPYQVTTAKPGA